MNKKLLFGAIAFLAVTFVPSGVKTNNEYVSAAEDFSNTAAIALTGRKNAKTTDSSKGADPSVGNENSALCSRMVVQEDSTTKALRYVIAVKSLDISVTFNATLTKEDGSVSYYETPADYAYTAILVSGSELTANQSPFSDSTNTYSYFVCYSMKGITQSNATLAVTATVENKDKSESAKVFKIASISNQDYTLTSENSFYMNGSNTQKVSSNEFNVTIGDNDYTFYKDSKTGTAYVYASGDVTVLDYAYAIGEDNSITVYKVTGISIFEGPTNVTLPKTVTAVNEGAFEWYALPNIIFKEKPESVKIGNNTIDVGDDLTISSDEITDYSSAWVISY